MERRHKKVRLEMLLSCLLPVVGLNNFLRFPSLAYENGGGAFWYAYVIATWTIGITILFLNLSLGQFTSSCGVKLYSKFGIGFSGIAITQAYTCICVSIYYCVLSSYILIYVYYSVSKRFSWSQCEEEWGDKCVSLDEKLTPNKNYTSSADYFFMFTVLGATYVSGKLESLNWKVLLCIIISVAIVVLYLSVKSLKMEDTFIALIIVPFVLMCALTGIAASMEGGLRGFRYFFSPDFSHLKKIDVWFKVLTHCLFSLGQGLGILTMFSSRNYFTMNLRWATGIVAIFQVCETSMVGMITFAVLSNLSNTIDEDLTSIIRSNNDGVPFIVYSIVLSQVSEIPFIMAPVLFVMLYAVALLSIAVLFQFVALVITQFDTTLNIGNTIALGCVCISFLTTLWYANMNEGGMIKVFNSMCVPVLIISTVFVDLMVVMYFYGMQKFCLDLQYMFKKKINPFLRTTWMIVLPLVIILVTVAYFVISNAMELTGSVLILTGILPVPVMVVYYLYQNKSLPFSQRIQKIFDNTNFGPEDPDIRQAWSIFKDEELQKKIDRKDNRCVDFLKSLVGK